MLKMFFSSWKLNPVDHCTRYLPFIGLSSNPNRITGAKFFCVNIWSSHRRCSIRKGIFKSFARFTGKHLCQSLLFNNIAGLRLATLLKKRLWDRCFPLNFAKILRSPILQNTSERMLLK